MKTENKDISGCSYQISDEEIERLSTWTDGERIRWICETASFILSLQTREERIAAYRLKQGKNVKYYDTYGWPENF